MIIIYHVLTNTRAPLTWMLHHIFYCYGTLSFIGWVHILSSHSDQTKTYTPKHTQFLIVQLFHNQPNHEHSNINININININHPIYHQLHHQQMPKTKSVRYQLITITIIGHKYLLISCVCQLFLYIPSTQSVSNIVLVPILMDTTQAKMVSVWTHPQYILTLCYIKWLVFVLGGLSPFGTCLAFSFLPLFISICPRCKCARTHYHYTRPPHPIQIPVSAFLWLQKNEYIASHPSQYIRSICIPTRTKP